jgi:hypothetical protein
MSEKRISNYPEQMNGDGVARLWRSVLVQAIEDLQTDRFRYDASQFLFTSDSDLCFACLNADAEQFRAKLRERKAA